MRAGTDPACRTLHPIEPDIQYHRGYGVIERDYIMRMIDQLSKVLARILFLKTSHEFPKAAHELATASRNLLGLDRELILLMSDTQLIELLKAEDAIAGPKCYVLGMLLKEEAALASAGDVKDREEGLLIKSLSLLTEAYSRSGGLVVPSHGLAIDAVCAALHGVPLPLQVNERLFTYYEATGRYDRAEDVLFDMIDQDTRHIHTGLQFYERLGKKDDAELIRGNLPRDEVNEALRELANRARQPG